ncbi:hypothetical protein ACFVP3_23755 [Streptomyces sp. NPDC057806]|uniref:hypothetical protein n=1 Tax=Streptomyces sp. NPDC057806 TaxID=3346255 RepID=UPI003686D01C
MYATTPVLCLGPVETPADVKALRALAYNVAYELGRPAVWVTDTDHTVMDYAAVYVTGDATSLRDASTLVLLGEALVADMDIHEPLAADEVVTCDCGLVHRHTRPVVDAQGVVWCANCLGDDACSWCGEELDTEAAEIVESGNGFYPVHAACLAGIRRDASTSRLHASA